jgi:hypothetical protein
LAGMRAFLTGRDVELPPILRGKGRRDPGGKAIRTAAGPEGPTG